MSVIKFVYHGRLTSGYYNDMEAGHPVFIDGGSLSDVVKGMLVKRGLDPEFCYGSDGGDDNDPNPLIGKRVKLILEVEN